MYLVHDDSYKTIDGNYSKHVIGYCTYHRGYVSERQARVHKCHRKHGGTCGRLANMEGRLIKRMNQQQFYDKMINRMDKMCGSLEKIVRTLEATQKSSKSLPEQDLVVPMNTHVRLEAKTTDSHYGNITIE